MLGAHFLVLRSRMSIKFILPRRCRRPFGFNNKTVIRRNRPGGIATRSYCDRETRQQEQSNCKLPSTRNMMDEYSFLVRV